MPVFMSNGSETLESVKHRFLVMERYGKDIWQIFLDQDRRFPEHTVYRIALQMVSFGVSSNFLANYLSLISALCPGIHQPEKLCSR
jgi:hypothetical protein